MTRRRFTIADLRRNVAYVNLWLRDIPGEWRLEIAQDATGTSLHVYKGKDKMETIGGGTMLENSTAASDFYSEKHRFHQARKKEQNDDSA